MRNDLDILERIDQYLAGNMSVADQVTFEGMMESDPGLRSLVDQQEVLIQAINRKALSKQIGQIAVAGAAGGSGFNGWQWGVGIVTGICIVIGSYFMFKSDDTVAPIQETEQVIASTTVTPEENHKVEADGIIVIEQRGNTETDETDVTEEVEMMVVSSDSTALEIIGETTTREGALTEVNEGSEMTILNSERNHNPTEENRPAIDTPTSDERQVDIVFNVEETTELHVEKRETVSMFDKDEIKNKANMPVSTKASFPGGVFALKEYIETYFVMDSRIKREGDLLLEFLIKEDGTITDIKVVEGVSKKVDQRAIELVESMPNWIPATYYGDPIESYFTLPISLGERTTK